MNTLTEKDPEITYQDTTDNSFPNIEELGTATSNQNTNDDVLKNRDEETIIDNNDATEIYEINTSWGTTVWNMLHTLAEHINEKSFNEIREEFLYIIYCICTSLPCENCNCHAKGYFDNKINFLEAIKDELENPIITNKEELRMFLFDFHNEVNSNLNKPLMMIEEYKQKYSDMNVIKVITDYVNKTKLFMRHGYSTLINFLLNKHLKHFLT